MRRADDPFVDLAPETLIDDFAVLEKRPVSSNPAAESPATGATPSVGRLHGFDLQDQPLIGNLVALPGRIVVGRSTVALRRAMIGHDVVVLFENGDGQRPIIMGVIECHALQEDIATPVRGVSIRADGERHVVEAEREIVLRCGDASITLTRAGKVIIKGNYILSRSTGYNKIKGAAIDIN